MFRRLPYLAVLLALYGAPVSAHGLCMDRSLMVRWLGSQHGEVRRGGVLPSSVMPLELYAAGLGRSWTLLKAHPPGMACIKMMGQKWNGNIPKLPGEGT